MTRLAPQPAELIDRATPVRFTFNSTAYTGFAGDTIASALAAEDVKMMSRSFKYHRPRGLMTADALDPGCIFQVDDEPNVRGARRRIAEGMQVSTQNTWPSLQFDVKSINRFGARFLSAGFYYKTFIWPRRLWPTYESLLQRFIHAGALSPGSERASCDKRFAHPDVLVVGGGPAGLAAAIGAAEDGARVLLVEEQHQTGGHLCWGGRDDLALLASLRARLARLATVEVLTDAVAVGRYDDNWVAVVQHFDVAGRERIIKARAKALVVAPGLIERPCVFAGNDLPGVMLSGAVRRLIKLYAVKPGQRAVVVTANPEGDTAVADLRESGVEIAHIEDARAGGAPLRAIGRREVRAAELKHGGRIDCDLLVTATGWTAPTSLLNMAGDLPRYDSVGARYVPTTAARSSGVFAAGGVVGDGSPEQLIDHGRAVGRAAARQARVRAVAFSCVPTRPDDAPAPRAPGPPVEIPSLPVSPHPQLFCSGTGGFVDFSEDVTSKDVEQAVAEGYDSIELAKRYTTATMGPAQGKLELMNTIALHARATGRTISQTGTTSWRPPYVPVSLGALAGRMHEPLRCSPMHSWHQGHGAHMVVAGQWIRPDHYGDPHGEVLCVRQRVGIIDVTPIGKLDLRGPDVPALLNLLYVNEWSTLDIGRVRYGVMCAEDGVVLDDGVTGRLGIERYLTCTTSSGAAAVWEWAQQWLQVYHHDWRVHVTPMTSAYASINVAGPDSRHLLAQIIDGIDLDHTAFPYMHVRTATVAGVDDCIIWRIGFTGELSYELHIPASYGLHVWQQLLAHGAQLGVRPFGLEAQRILRLEKGHPIIGQDTDALTQPAGAGVGPGLGLHKADFLGRPELLWQSHEVARGRLVAVQPVNPAVIPPEASQIVDGDNKIVGRITSSRMSPTLSRGICLAQVDDGFCTPGTELTVQLIDGTRIPARVHEHLAHFDPEGGRQRG